MARSDLTVVLGAIPRILEACRTRSVADPPSGVRVSGNQLRILRQLDDRDPAMVGELAEFMGVTASTMSLNLKRLEEAGLISRGRDPADRRVRNVLLTDLGRRIRDRHAPLDPVRVDAVLRALRPDRRARAVDGVALLAEAADRLSARGEAYLHALAGEAPGAVDADSGSSMAP